MGDVVSEMANCNHIPELERNIIVGRKRRGEVPVFVDVSQKDLVKTADWERDEQILQGKCCIEEPQLQSYNKPTFCDGFKYNGKCEQSGCSFVQNSSVQISSQSE